ncbi:MAG TPA: PIN domain-containing protein [Myxococcaceae bacterium]|nr:PIN domain-containing protein [Myxococcaceae bacterium]
MICVDTSSLVAFLSGGSGADLEQVERALAGRSLLLPPVVQTEVLSDPGLRAAARAAILDLPLADLLPGFWGRAGELRARILKAGRKARLADALISQTALDLDVPLITRDRDFRAYRRYGHLRLVEP